MVLGNLPNFTQGLGEIHKVNLGARFTCNFGCSVWFDFNEVPSGVVHQMAFKCSRSLRILHPGIDI